MRIEVYRDTPEEEEKVLRLRLENVGTDEVQLHAVDERGKCGVIILAICKDGIYRSKIVSGNPGLPLDFFGRVKDTTP